MYVICRYFHDHNGYHLQYYAAATPPWSDKIEDSIRYNSKDDVPELYEELYEDTLASMSYVETYARALALAHNHRLGLNAIFHW